MRSLARNALFSFLALYYSTSVFTGLVFNEPRIRNMVLMALGIGLVNLLAKPALRIMSLWYEGIGYLFVGVFVNLICVFIIDRIYSGVQITEGFIKNLNVFGIVVESYGISEYWGFLLLSLALSLFILVGDWVAGRNQKKKQ